MIWRLTGFSQTKYVSENKTNKQKLLCIIRKARFGS